MIVINGAEFELDTMDLEVSEKIDSELKKFGEKVNSIGNTATRTGVIKGFVLATSNFFDSVLGNGSAEKIFNGKKNFNLAIHCMDQFVEEIDKNDKAAASEMEVINKKYSPNRAKRRSKK